MNSLLFYTNTILNFDILNKFNEKKKIKIHKLVISANLKNKTNLKNKIQELLALEILLIKRNFYLTIVKGRYTCLKLDIYNNFKIEKFLLKYIWLFFPKIFKNLSVTNILKKNVKSKTFFNFKLNLIKKLEFFFNFKDLNNININLVLKSHNLKFFFKSLKLSF